MLLNTPIVVSCLHVATASVCLVVVVVAVATAAAVAVCLVVVTTVAAAHEAVRSLLFFPHLLLLSLGNRRSPFWHDPASPLPAVPPSSIAVAAEAAAAAATPTAASTSLHPSMSSNTKASNKGEQLYFKHTYSNENLQQ